MGCFTGDVVAPSHDFSDAQAEMQMAPIKRASASAAPVGRSGRSRTPLSKSSLLPTPQHAARDLSLAHHLALATCRDGKANKHQISELLRAIYMTYYLQCMGFGDAPYECYERAESALKRSITFAIESAIWQVCERGVAEISPILAMHDQQLAQAPLHYVVQAEKRLRAFMAGGAESPLVRVHPF